MVATAKAVPEDTGTGKEAIATGPPAIAATENTAISPAVTSRVEISPAATEAALGAARTEGCAAASVATDLASSHAHLIASLSRRSPVGFPCLRILPSSSTRG